MATWAVMGPLWWLTHTQRLLAETSKEAGERRYAKIAEFVLIGGPLVMIGLCVLLWKDDQSGAGRGK